MGLARRAQAGDDAGAHSSGKALGGLLCEQITIRAAIFWNLGDRNQHGIIKHSVASLLISKRRIERFPDKTAPSKGHIPAPSFIRMICTHFVKADLSGKLASLFLKDP
jgi:hypothetical protein